MNIAVIGSRTYVDKRKVFEVLDEKRRIHADFTVVSGGAAGADYLGELWATTRGLPTRIFKPDWRRFGRSAAFRRNLDIISHADLVVAFWDLQSKGTAHSLSLANDHNIPTEIHD